MTVHAFIHHGVESSTGCFKLMLSRMIADAIKMVELMVLVLFRSASAKPRGPSSTGTR